MNGFRFWHEAVLVGLLAVLLCAAGVLDARFLRPSIQLDLSTHMWEMALLTVPMTLIIITAGIDLSIGAMMALSAVTLGLTFQAGWPPWLGAGLAIGVGGLAGVFMCWRRIVGWVSPSNGLTPVSMKYSVAPKE